MIDNKDAEIDIVSNGMKLNAIVGNHDIGFHYSLTRRFKERFEKHFKTDSVDLIKINDINFVTVNSVTMEGDYCSMCADTESKLIKIGKTLCPNPKNCIRPVLLTHFPLYRESDKDCDEPDTAPDSIKFDKFKEKWDCLSQNATKLLLDVLNPKLILTGHVHYGCITFHKKKVQEWTVASFNWRNIHAPTFLLVKMNRDHYAIRKCYLPNEIFVIFIYVATSILILIIFSKSFIKRFYKRNQYYINY